MQIRKPVVPKKIFFKCLSIFCFEMRLPQTVYIFQFQIFYTNWPSLGNSQQKGYREQKSKRKKKKHFSLSFPRKLSPLSRWQSEVYVGDSGVLAMWPLKKNVWRHALIRKTYQISISSPSILPSQPNPPPKNQPISYLLFYNVFFEKT